MIKFLRLVLPLQVASGSMVIQLPRWPCELSGRDMTAFMHFKDTPPEQLTVLKACFT